MNFLEFRKAEFERRDLRLKHSRPMELVKTNEQKKRLHIVYVMTWVGVCGGSKIIMQHCNKLVERGHRATIVCHFPKPTWFPLSERVGFVHAPFGEVLGEYIPRCDVIVATYWKEIYECVEQKLAPVVYFEQGDSHLFEPESYGVERMSHIKKQISLAPFVYTVSSFAAEKLKEIFNAEAEVIPNALDKTVFFADKDTEEDKENKITITTIGSENIPFKCIYNIVIAVQILIKLGYNIEFIWISPDSPSALTTIPVKINLPQGEIGNCLRRSDIYICASLYESFCLPVLEAMSCGAAVVTTDNGGIRDFVEDGNNAIVINKNNIADMVDKVAMLIDNPELREKLIENARKTACIFDWDSVADRLLDYYKKIASHEIL